MTISYVAAGTSATGNNAPVTPGLPAGVQEADIVVVSASIRNSGTGTVNLPAGWTDLVNFGNLRVFCKRYTATGFTMPTVTFTAGAAGDDTIGQSFAVRSASQDLPTILSGTPGTLLNGSAQDIATPGMTILDANCLAVRIAWKQDDATSYSLLAGYTAGPFDAPTAGNDASQGVFYRTANAGALSSGSHTVTGGLAAISRAIVFALKSAPVITATAQVSYPTRVLVSVTGLALGDDIAVYRQVAGQRTLLRAGSAADVLDPSFLVIDAELPFGVAVTYVAVVNSFAEYATSPTTYTLAGGKVAISDAVSGIAAETVILSWPEKARDTNSSVYRAAARNIVVSGPLGQFTSAIEFYVETTSAVANLTEALASATSNTLQIRQAGGYDGVDCYVAVLKSTEKRWSQDGSDQRRVIAVDAVEVSGWAPTLEAAGFTLLDIANYYGVSGTLADIDADFTSLLDIAQASFVI